MLTRKHAALITCLTLISAGFVQAQENPFGGTAAPEGDPFATQGNDPFATGGGATSPFDAINTGASPFDAPAGGAQAAPANPFAGGEATPFGAPPTAPAQPVADPFGGDAGQATTVGTEATGQPVSQESNPFGAPPTPEASGASPFAGLFGGGEATGDLFGGSPAAATTTLNEGGGITTLYDFRYKEFPRITGKTVVVRERMTWEEAEAFDVSKIQQLTDSIQAGEVSAYDPTTSAADWAEWLHYADQLTLWNRYVADVLLVDTEVTVEDFPIAFPGDARAGDAEAAAGGNAGGELGLPSGKGGAEGIVAANQNRTLDDQANDFNPFANLGSGGNEQQNFLDPKLMNDQAAALYNYYFDSVRQKEDEQMKFVNRMLNDLENRQVARVAYDNWRESQIESILEFMDEWERQYDGKVTTIAGVRYELYLPENVPAFTTRGANIVVTDGDLTPYDLLNNDGSLKKPNR